jgi:uncharacterized membrane protein YdbT with pleckstrin-like domain
MYAAFISFYISIPGKHSTSSLATDLGWDLSSIAMLFFIVFIVIYISHILYSIIWRSTFSFDFMPEYITMRSGIISRNETHVPYHTVQDVVVSQGIVERLFGLATLKIQNAAAAQMVGKRLVIPGINLPGQPLEKANRVSDIVKSVLLRKNFTGTGL